MAIVIINKGSHWLDLCVPKFGTPGRTCVVNGMHTRYARGWRHVNVCRNKGLVLVRRVFHLPEIAYQMAEGADGLSGHAFPIMHYGLLALGW